METVREPLIILDAELSVKSANKAFYRTFQATPEETENHCIYVDAFLGARKAEQTGPISPYLGYSKEDEARTQRKILRYWRDKGVDAEFTINATSVVVAMVSQEYTQPPTTARKMFRACLEISAT